jgi:putative tricarboxylic transport membrane protein
VKNIGIWGGVLLAGYSIVLFVQSFDLHYYTRFGPGPGFLPLWLSVGLFFLSAVFIVQSAKQPMLFKNKLPRGQRLSNVLSMLGAILLFIIIVRVTGFVTACTLMVFIVVRRHYHWRMGLLVALCISLVLLVVFQSILDVPLPDNYFGWTTK